MSGPPTVYGVVVLEQLLEHIEEGEVKVSADTKVLVQALHAVAEEVQLLRDSFGATSGLLLPMMKRAADAAENIEMQG